MFLHNPIVYMIFLPVNASRVGLIIFRKDMCGGRLFYNQKRFPIPRRVISPYIIGKNILS